MNLFAYASMFQLVTATRHLFVNKPQSEQYFGNGDIDDTNAEKNKLHFASSNEELLKFFKYEQSKQHDINTLLPWSKAKEAYLKMVDFK